ncbi:MAG: septal ring lytic transglycosylase RlpA family protein [Acidiferrobacter sp.]
MGKRGHCSQNHPAWVAATVGLAITLTGCSFLPSVGYRNPQDISHRNVVVHKLPLSPYGNSPYTVNGRTYYPLKSAAGYRQRGIASWYGRPFNGQKTSDGEIYNMYAMTAANKVLPLPSYALVRNLKNNRSVIVRINDRGPFYPHRIIDLSYAAAARLGVLATGTAPVLVEGLTPGQDGGRAPERPIRPHPHRGPDVFGVHGDGSLQPAFFLQFGAFSRHRDAVRLTRRLRQKGLRHLHIFPNTINGRRLYIVRMGPEADKHEARALASRVSREGLGPTFIVDP